MEDLKKKAVGQEGGDKDIIFSKAIKAGKRIYYLDVKKSRNDEMYLAITESKKIYAGIGENAQLNFEKLSGGFREVHEWLERSGAIYCGCARPVSAEDELSE